MDAEGHASLLYVAQTCGDQGASGILWAGIRQARGGWRQPFPQEDVLDSPHLRKLYADGYPRYSTPRSGHEIKSGLNQVASFSCPGEHAGIPACESRIGFQSQLSCYSSMMVLQITG